MNDRRKVILGVESSFDDSAACLVNAVGELMSENVKFSQPQFDQEFSGGVDPKRAEEHHRKYLPMAVEKAMEGTAVEDVEAIAVTIGPG